MSEWPLEDAHINAVAPYLSAWCTSAPFCDGKGEVECRPPPSPPFPFLGRRRSEGAARVSLRPGLRLGIGLASHSAVSRTSPLALRLPLPVSLFSPLRIGSCWSELRTPGGHLPLPPLLRVQHDTDGCQRAPPPVCPGRGVIPLCPLSDGNPPMWCGSLARVSSPSLTWVATSRCAVSSGRIFVTRSVVGHRPPERRPRVLPPRPAPSPSASRGMDPGRGVGQRTF